MGPVNVFSFIQLSNFRDPGFADQLLKLGRQTIAESNGVKIGKIDL